MGGCLRSPTTVKKYISVGGALMPIYGSNEVIWHEEGKLMSDFQELIKSFPKIREYVRDFLSMDSKPEMILKRKAPVPTTISGDV